MSFYYRYLTYLNSSLTVPEDGAKYYADKKDGKYRVNTDPNRGADTFIPFSRENVAYGNTGSLVANAVKTIPLDFTPDFVFIASDSLSDKNNRSYWVVGATNIDLSDVSYSKYVNYKNDSNAGLILGSDVIIIGDNEIQIKNITQDIDIFLFAAKCKN